MDHNPDLDLLFKPDGWLDNHLMDLTQELDILRSEIKAAKRAKAIKRDLQSRNVIVVMDMFSLMSISTPTDAIATLAEDIAKNPGIMAVRNATSQIATWEADGYTTRPEH